MNFIREIEANSAEIRLLRQDIHAHPELGFDVHRTAELVASKLEEWGIAVTREVGLTGVVGTLVGTGTGAGADRAIGLRADMDALPIQEVNTVSYASTHAGKMHACGHDGHTAMLLGAAQYLAKHRDFTGTVQFYFQPAEEGLGGAKKMIEDGLFDRFPCDVVFGVHNWPNLPANTFGVRSDSIMASSNRFKITIDGTGAHAAMPQRGKDPLFAGTQIVTALQSIISRNKRPIDNAVLSVSQFHAGSSDNVMPDKVWLSGTVRTFDEAVTDLIETRLTEIAEGTALAFGCRAKVDFIRAYPPTVNDPVQARFAADVAAEVFGKDKVIWEIDPTMAAEDFSFMLRERPGCYAFIGNGSGEHRGHEHGMGPCELHNASFDFNDDLLPGGASYFVGLVNKYLTNA